MSAETESQVITTKLLGREEVAEGTMAFRYERPQNWVFTAGQFVEVSMPDLPAGQAWRTHTFSIASAPEEDFLMNATRLSGSEFKNSLSTIPLGSRIKIEGPFGDLVLHEDSARAAVLLTGGIGITPMRGIVIDAARRKLPHKIFLFYSNRRPEDAAFLTELAALEKENPNYRFIATMTQMEKSSRPWKGETGYITKQMLDKYLSGAKSPIYYITGPGEMLNALRKMLTDGGVKREDIRAEDFPGY